jgi:hypothetical protein
MSEKDDGGPAFPWGEHGTHLGGATLRDYFAAKAMQAMITKSNGQGETGGAAGVPVVAEYAYEYADAMIEARKQ